MLASGHGAGKCEPKPALVADLDRVNAEARARGMYTEGKSPESPEESKSLDTSGSRVRAFPNRRHGNSMDGMLLRDWFAGLAMQSMLPDLSCEEMATKAYELADAMLKERAR